MINLKLFGRDKAKDPVCGMEIEVDKARFKSEYQGKTYYFCSQSDKTQFEKDPTKYLEGEHSEHMGHNCC